MYRFVVASGLGGITMQLVVAASLAVVSLSRRQRQSLCQRRSETVVGESVGGQEDCNQSMLKQAATKAMVPRTEHGGLSVADSRN